jgi:DNA-binding MarR family transcriptional regulator
LLIHRHEQVFVQVIGEGVCDPGSEAFAVETFRPIARQAACVDQPESSLTSFCRSDKLLVVMPKGLLDEARLLFHALRQWSETLHAELGMTAAMRGLLELILLAGPATVPDMARARGVSRQHVQQQVDALLERSLVERQDNPAHKRSSMIALTSRGHALIQNVRAEELHALSRIQVGVSDHAMLEAAQVLSGWRTALQRDTARRTH